MSEWKKVRLGDIVLFNPRESIKKGAVVKKIAMDKLAPYTRLITGYEAVPFSSGTKFRNGDTLMARITPCLENGKIAQVSILEKGEIAFGSTEYIVFRNIEGVTDRHYVYYFVTSPWFRDIAIKSMVGSSGRQRVQQDVLENLYINLPPLEEQRRIAAILGSLDDKIELNNRINKNLEEQASALFKRWFVDFEFPDPDGNPYKSAGGKFIDSPLGAIPEGWRVGTLSDLIYVKYGKDHKKLNDGVIPVYGSGGVMRYVDCVLYDKESVLIPRKGTLNNITYINTPFWSVDTMFFSEMKQPNVAKVVYFFLKEKDMASMNAGSAVPSMTTEILNSMPIIIADEKIYQSYDNVVSEMFSAISNNTKQNERLAQMRDSLLPKLMNNEIKL